MSGPVLPDLGSVKCTHLVLRADIPSTLGSKSISDFFGERITGKNPFLISETYAASGYLHEIVLAVVRQGRRQQYQLVLHVDCEWADDREPGLSSKIPAVLEGLQQLGFESEFSTDALFVLDGEVAHRFFPLKLPGIWGTVVDEFRGIRGVKLNGSEVSYVLSLDSPQLEVLYANIETHGTNIVFTADILTRSLDGVVEALSHLIPEIGKGVQRGN